MHKRMNATTKQEVNIKLLNVKNPVALVFPAAIKQSHKNVLSTKQCFYKCKKEWNSK